MFNKIGKGIGRITVLEISFWGTPGFCVLRGKTLKSLFAVYFLNGRIYFQFLYLPELSIKIGRKYAIDIINLIGFIPIAWYFYQNQYNETAKYIFYSYLIYMIVLFFFTDAKPEEKQIIQINEKQKLIEKGQ